MPLLPLAAALALLAGEPAPAAPAPTAAPVKAQAPAKGAARKLPAPAALPTLEGTVIGADHRAHVLRLRTAAGESAIPFDRNTRVRGTAGAATVLELTAGSAVRVGLDGERAAWVEVRPAPPAPKAAP